MKQRDITSRSRLEEIRNVVPSQHSPVPSTGLGVLRLKPRAGAQGNALRALTLAETHDQYDISLAQNLSVKER